MVQYLEQLPSTEDFLHIREVRLSEKAIEAVRKGLPNSLYSVIAVSSGMTIGMGRIVGDGGLNFEIVDIAVLPKHQGKGIGKRIMEYIMAYLDENAPASAYISLMADVPAFYEKFGFILSRPSTEGMYQVKKNT